MEHNSCFGNCEEDLHMYLFLVTLGGDCDLSFLEMRTVQDN